MSADNCVLCKVIVRDDGSNASSDRHCAHEISSYHILAYIRTSDAGVMLIHPPFLTLAIGAYYECDGLPCPSDSIVFYESKSYGCHLRSNLSRLDLVHSQYSRPEVTPSLAFHVHQSFSFFPGLLLLYMTERARTQPCSTHSQLGTNIFDHPSSFSNKRSNKR